MYSQFRQFNKQCNHVQNIMLFSQIYILYIKLNNLVWQRDKGGFRGRGPRVGTPKGLKILYFNPKDKITNSCLCAPLENPLPAPGDKAKMPNKIDREIIKGKERGKVDKHREGKRKRKKQKEQKKEEGKTEEKRER